MFRSPRPHRSNRPRSSPGFESLERRSMMSATISGSVLRDMSGNGLTIDDQPLAGSVVKLYKDINLNGKLDALDHVLADERREAGHRTDDADLHRSGIDADRHFLLALTATAAACCCHEE